MSTQNCMDTICDANIGSKTPVLPRVGIVSAARRVAIRIADTLMLWQERVRQRHHLAALDPHLLKDIGVSRADAWREANKPFWRP